ncbi:ral guanine nucleotide dissociation stimulator-like [Rattus norvegicus]|uniref:N-terminal Ras-GEF domain-containing protein n=1 Tax=Rattus norvegicus TaxID=10116 RepID=A0ABK0LCG5_RAT|nr:ral guanine nucleotide dissociation stimulator-like [Rattus norvegicus]|eukprot:XP_017456628.1 PREDICTED: ral guanine nucleotide dissociation stimulator-like [Rattus norvegicus]
MFSCCLRTTRGSGLKKDNREGHGGVWRHRVGSCLQRLWPFSRKGRSLTRSSQGQEHTDKDENDSAAQDLRESYRDSNFSTEAVVKLRNNLGPSLQEGDTFYVPAFVITYQRFDTPLLVLDQLFLRYANFSPYCEEDEQINNTLCSFLETWMDKNTSELFILKYIKAYFDVCMAHLDLSVHVNRFMTLMQDNQAKDSHPRMSKAQIWGDTHPQIHRLDGCKTAGKESL